MDSWEYSNHQSEGERKQCWGVGQVGAIRRWQRSLDQLVSLLWNRPSGIAVMRSWGVWREWKHTVGISIAPWQKGPVDIQWGPWACGRALALGLEFSSGIPVWTVEQQKGPGLQSRHPQTKRDVLWKVQLISYHHFILGGEHSVSNRNYRNEHLTKHSWHNGFSGGLGQ